MEHLTYYEKHQQAQKEARASVLALVALVVFWCVAGFGMSHTKLVWLSVPAWVWLGIGGTWICACALAVYLVRHVFVSFDLGEESSSLSASEVAHD